jgi:GNAT superfamily N-acetyltransferase
MIRRATREDVPQIARFIRDLAAYERLEHECDPDEARLREHLFGQAPVCGAFLAEHDGRPVGFALYFQTYSTFKSMPCMHLEDLFVVPEARGNGLGLALLRAVAAEAVARGCPRLDWNVLEWNAPAIRFYESRGARLLADWRTCRLDGAGLRRVAADAAGDRGKATG